MNTNDPTLPAAFRFPGSRCDDVPMTEVQALAEWEARRSERLRQAARDLASELTKPIGEMIDEEIAELQKRIGDLSVEELVYQALHDPAPFNFSDPYGKGVASRAEPV